MSATAAGLIPLSILATAGQATSILGTAISLIALYREFRDRWRETNPGKAPVDEQGNPIVFVEDSELIEGLRGDGKTLEAMALALINGKYAATPAPEQEAGPESPGTGGQ